MLEFIVLYPLIWFFERKRDGVDGWNVAISVGIPAVISILVLVGTAAFEVQRVGQLINFAMFPIVLGLCLWQIVGLPGKRAATYSILYFLIMFGIGIILNVTGVVQAS